MTAPATAKQLVDKLWSYCHVLRHDGVSTIDYVDQHTLLLFLKMADERAHRKLAAERIEPEGDDWQALLKAKGDDGSGVSRTQRRPDVGKACDVVLRGRWREALRSRPAGGDFKPPAYCVS